MSGRLSLVNRPAEGRWQRRRHTPPRYLKKQATSFAQQNRMIRRTQAIPTVSFGQRNHAVRPRLMLSYRTEGAEGVRNAQSQRLCLEGPGSERMAPRS